MKAAFISLGCAKNLVDSECILGLLKDGNVEIIDDIYDSDVIFVNTCGFIIDAKKEAINTIFDVINQKKKNALLVVLGCLAKRYKKELLEEIPEIDLVVGVDEYDTIGEKLNKLLKLKMPKTFRMIQRSLSNPLPTAYLKIGEGCSNKCAYCAIPIIRGDYYSYKKEDIINDAKRLISLGKKEIVIIAQDPTRYGKDIYEDYDLSDLLNDLTVLNREVFFRVLYLYPDRIDDDLIESFKNNWNLVPYFDIPIQHSSDRMLSLMSRSGTRQKYIDVIKKIRENIKKTVLRTTLIVGFPGETEKDYEDLVSFIKEIKFDHLGVFSFSDEEDTPANNMDGKIPVSIAREREKEIMMIQKKISLELNKNRIGETHKVMIEDFDGKNYYGRSYLYAPDADDGCFIIPYKKDLIIGEVYDVKIIKVKPYDVVGVVL